MSRGHQEERGTAIWNLRRKDSTKASQHIQRIPRNIWKWLNSLFIRCNFGLFYLDVKERGHLKKTRPFGSTQILCKMDKSGDSLVTVGVCVVSLKDSPGPQRTSTIPDLLQVVSEGRLNEWLSQQMTSNQQYEALCLKLITERGVFRVKWTDWNMKYLDNGATRQVVGVKKVFLFQIMPEKFFYLKIMKTYQTGYSI